MPDGFEHPAQVAGHPVIDVQIDFFVVDIRSR